MLFSNILGFWAGILNLNLPENLQNKDGVSDLIRSEGYPVRVHTVPTDDGYLLGMHHIPPRHASGRYNNVLLMHAALTAGGQFIINGNKSLAFMLSNAGYNVWILHARGTSYSLKHRTLSNETPKFWDYTWHDIGVYDIPCAIDYILRVTRQDKLHFVGHSQGPTAYFVMMSQRPEYNDRILSAYLLGPAVYVHNTYKAMRGMTNLLMKLAKEQKIFKLQLKESALLYFLLNFCKGPFLSLWCTNAQLMALGGDTGEIIDRHAFKHTVAKYARDNVSTKQLYHFAQVQNSERFQMYDYGYRENLVLYGMVKPPEYNLSASNVPLMIAYGTKDSLTEPKDIEILIPKLRNVQKVIKLPWNHVDMVLGKSVDTKLYNHILTSMKRY